MKVEIEKDFGLGYALGALSGIIVTLALIMIERIY